MSIKVLSKNGRRSMQRLAAEVFMLLCYGCLVPDHLADASQNQVLNMSSLSLRM